MVREVSLDQNQNLFEEEETQIKLNEHFDPSHCWLNIIANQNLSMERA